MFPIVDKPIRATKFLDDLKRGAINAATQPPCDAHQYSSGQSCRNCTKDAVYVTFTEHREETIVFIAEFENPADAGYAAAALNSARPYEYSIIDLITNASSPQLEPVAA